MKKYGLLPVVLILAFTAAVSQPGFQTNTYHRPDEINRYLQELHKKHIGSTALHLIGTSWSGTPVYLMEIGGEKSQQSKSQPAVFVAANFEGDRPLATEAALWLISDLLNSPEHRQNLTWYVLPVGNPDAAMSYFESPRQVTQRNNRPYNDDMDDQTDEDPAEDLNGDGYITMMRVREPGGTMIPDSLDARIMRRADPAKGVKGIYTLYTEGVDNDKDGKYNEDGRGGTNNGIAFPHLFDYSRNDNGLWPGQEEEVFGVMKFLTDHPEIALTMYYGGSNFCLLPPTDKRKGEVNLSSLKIPSRYAGMLGADPAKTYSMEEVKDLIKNIVPPGTEVDDAMVAGMLGLGAAVNILPKDLKIYEKLSADYHTYLKEQKVETDRLSPQPAKDGSFELWTYYHMGLPSFSQDLWGVPLLKTPNDTLSNAKAQASGSGNPKQGAKKPDPDKTFLQYSDSLLRGQGFVEWTTFNHPGLGEVEIGGVVPWANLAPPAGQIAEILEKKVPWIYELAKNIPDIRIEHHELTPLGEGLYRLEAWFRNEGDFHFPIAMGVRNGNPPPAIILLEGAEIEFLEGKARTALGSLESGQIKKQSWLLRLPGKGKMKVSVHPVNAFGSVSTIDFGGPRS